ncbi:hypothetical protein FT641_19360 [Bacillus paranthracis]|uniref:hypothetical protein n=1 Tax=Bacillus paranthracis TaxID=2026186 RepID=UPI001879F0A2|nr:hypothetical protein [Bacillus paranthracis]MBE7114276.1 hypothetical protein [Bacillus paranthracis]MBE7154851.1 hypothetical protein [Bacillus paranthracis]
MTKKKDFFRVVKEKKELEKQFEAAEKEYYETTFWEAPDHVVSEEFQKLEQLREDIQTKRQELENLKEYFTKPELHEMRKEFYGESN